jgi:tRNA-dihydrouridine synthase 4
MPSPETTAAADMAEDTAAAWADLPTPERLPVRTMLDELETVNVLAPLVRCSKREWWAP